MAGVVLVPILAAVLADLLTGSKTVVSIAFLGVILLEVAVLSKRAQR